MVTMPTRVETDVYEAAKTVGAVMSRSAAQQITHWARIGREFEASAGISHRDIAQVLAGEAAYDTLSAREQALVRVEWDERITAAREKLDLAAEFAAAGEGWVEADDEGRVVTRSARA